MPYHIMYDHYHDPYLVAGLMQEALLYNSIVGLMTVAKLVHKEDKVMQLCVAVCDDRIVQQ